MPDATTQTPPEAVSPNARLKAKPNNPAISPIKSSMTAEMDSETWGECWKIIDRYASYYNPTQQESLVPHDEPSNANQQMMTRPIMGGPPIPGSGSTAYSEPDPGWKDPNILDTDMGEVEAVSVSGPHNMQVETESTLMAETPAGASETGTRIAHCPTPAPAYSPVVSPSHTPLSNPVNTLNTAILQCTQSDDDHVIMSAEQGRNESAFGSEAGRTHQGHCGGSKVVTEASAAQFDGASDQECGKSGDIDLSLARKEPTRDEIRHPPSAVPLDTKEQILSIAGASMTEDRTGQILNEEKGENGMDYVESVKDQELPSQTLESKSPGRAVRFPDSYHQQVLAEAIEQGANHEQQEAILAGLRGVERAATLGELAKGTGAMEVDASELEANSAIRLPTLEPRSPSRTEDDRASRKRKNVGDHQVAPKKKASSVKDIVALTNDEHLANGWKELPKSHFENMKLPELKNYFRTIKNCQKWWNGLTKKITMDKIMAWQAEMRELAATNQADSEEDDTTSADGADEEEPMPADSKEHVKGNGLEVSSPLPRDASEQRQQLRASDALVETPVRQTDESSFVRSSPASQDSQHKLFYDPAAARRDSPLVQKFEAVQVEAMLQRTQSQDARPETDVDSSPSAHVQSNSLSGPSKPAAKDNGSVAPKHDNVKLEQED